MDYRDTVFLSVAEKLSFSKAAEELFISQPAVTKHIKELEYKLKVTLFTRNGSKISLTKAGQVCYKRLKVIRQLYNDLEFEIGSIGDGFKGELRIGASSTISQYIIPQIMADFHERYPNIKLFLINGNSSEMEKQLLDNDIDLALVENASSQANIRYSTFMHDEIVAVVGQNTVYSKRKNITISELVNYPIVLREKGSGTLDVIYKALLAKGMKPEDLKVAMHLGSTESIKSFISSFDGFALISNKAVEKDIAHGELVRINVKGLNITRSLRVANHQGHISEAAQLFIRSLNNQR